MRSSSDSAARGCNLGEPERKTDVPRRSGFSEDLGSIESGFVERCAVPRQLAFVIPEVVGKNGVSRPVGLSYNWGPMQNDFERCAIPRELVVVL